MKRGRGEERGVAKSRIDNETNCVGTGIIKVAVGSRRPTGSIFDRRILEREGTDERSYRCREARSSLVLSTRHLRGGGKERGCSRAR